MKKLKQQIKRALRGYPKKVPRTYDTHALQLVLRALLKLLP